MKINLGCGEKYLKGYVNCDIVASIKTDKVFDHNTFPYPFKSNSADEIFMDNVLEHLDNIVAVVEECHRILKKGGSLKIIVPYFKSDGAFQDPTHTHYFTENSMSYFAENHGYNYYTKKRFELKTAQLFCDNKTTLSKIRVLIPFKGLLKYFFFNIYDGINFELVKNN